MPLTVRAWPDSTDPRGSLFSIVGFGFGAVPPNQFQIKTTGALAPYTDLNDGVLITFDSDLGDVSIYLDASTDWRYEKAGWPDEQTGPPPFSVNHFLIVHRLPGPAYRGEIPFLFPYGITTFAITLSPLGGGVDKFPNPVVFTPRNHLATS